MKKALQKNALIIHFFIAVIVTLFLWAHNQLSLIFPFYVLLANISLGLLIFFHDRQKEANRFFFYITVCLAVWNISIFFIRNNNLPETIFIWRKIAYLSVSFIPALFLYFVGAYGRIEIKVSHIRKIVIVIPILAFPLAIFLDLIVSPSYIYPFHKPGLLYSLFFFYIISYFVLSFYEFIHKYQESQGINRLQMRYLGLGFFLSLIIAMCTNLLLPALGIVDYNWVGPGSSLILMGFIAYAILKHRLLDITFIIRKSLIYTFLLGIFTGIYLVFLDLASTFFSAFAGFSSMAFSLFLLVFFAMIFQPLKLYFQERIDKVFFRERYALAKSLENLGDKVIQIVDKKELIEFICFQLKKALQTDKIYVFLKEGKNQTYYSPVQFDSSQKIIEFNEQDGFITALKQSKQVIFIGDFDSEKGVVNSELKKLGIDMALVLKEKKGLLGFILVEKENALFYYSSEEEKLLNQLSHYLSIALENALLAEEKVSTQTELMRTDKLKSLGTIAAGMAHEIKNPLTVISGLAKSVKERYQEKDDEFFNDFDNVVPRQLDRIRKIAEELSQYGKQPKNEKKPVDLNKILEEVLAFFAGQCKEKNIRVEKKLGSIGKISADAEQITQVFTNLILNAIEAIQGMSLPAEVNDTKAGVIARSGATQQSLLTIESRIVDKSIEITVSDTGEGIDEDNLADIFEPFYTTKENGAGLGLAIVKKIVEEHNGQIKVFSQKNKGTTFIITFTSTV